MLTFKYPLFYLIIPKRSHKAPPLSEREKVLDTKKRKNPTAEVAKTSGQNESFICETVKKEYRCARLLSHITWQKLAKMEEALNLCMHA